MHKFWVLNSDGQRVSSVNADNYRTAKLRANKQCGKGFKVKRSSDFADFSDRRAGRFEF
jgi:hypothetical protein